MGSPIVYAANLREPIIIVVKRPVQREADNWAETRILKTRWPGR